MEVFTVLKLGKWVKFHQSKYIHKSAAAHYIRI